MIYINVLNFRS